MGSLAVVGGALSGGETDAVKPDRPESPTWTAARRILRCPMAAKWAYPDFGPFSPVGGTFLAWSCIPSGGPGAWFLGESSPWFWSGSYGPNGRARSAESRPMYADPKTEASWKTLWQTTLVKNASSVPVFLDSMMPTACMAYEAAPPPECDAIPTRMAPTVGGSQVFEATCINRHEGGTNSLFMDWSVRKVGIKENWALKWSPDYNTAGRWTKQGGRGSRTGPNGCGGLRITDLGVATRYVIPAKAGIQDAWK